MADFGANLRDARDRRGISLREIESKTKVSIAALESLERNDLTRLPGGIFARALVRSYASEVGLDPDATVRDFTARFNLEPPSSADPVAVEPDAGGLAAARHRAAVLVTILVASLVVAAILLFFTLSTAPDQSNSPAPPDRARPAGPSAGADRPGSTAANGRLS
jgi:cytoskeleton protein RodZ